MNICTIAMAVNLCKFVFTFKEAYSLDPQELLGWFY